MTNDEIDSTAAQQRSKRAAIKRRASVLDVALCCVMLAALAAVFVAFWPLVFSQVMAAFDSVPDASHSLGVMLAHVATLLLLMIGGYPVVFGLIALGQFVRRHWLVSYWIEEDAEALKVFGTVPLSDWSLVCTRLLDLRPDWRIADDETCRRLGCVMAVVPASSSYRAARNALAERGLVVRR